LCQKIVLEENSLHPFLDATADVALVAVRVDTFQI